MVDKNNFPDFEIPSKKQEELKGVNKLHQKVHLFCERKFGINSKVTKFISSLKTDESSNALDALTNIKRNKSTTERTNLILTIVLIIILLVTWKKGPAFFTKIDQLKNDIGEQELVIQMEEQNNLFLEKLDDDRSALAEKINIVYSAVPSADEKAEEIISMLESMADGSNVKINSIGIRMVPETQFYYDDLLGVADVYEYAFSVESSLSQVMSYIESIRRSQRIMDIMTLEIEEGQGVYKANFSVYAYHLIDEEEDESIDS